ncbi:hypothetical protein [Bauldia litoralis]|uniref:hypothetical protein n=1 Tax=Bauldia litoralis TaxID=665467 RepID=UPI003262EDFC
MHQIVVQYQWGIGRIETRGGHFFSMFPVSSLAIREFAFGGEFAADCLLRQVIKRQRPENLILALEFARFRAALVPFR